MTILEELVEEENKKLETFLESAIETLNICLRDKILSIKKTSYKQYKNILEIKYASGKTVYVNIYYDSIIGIASTLFNAVFDAKAYDILEEIYE